MIASASDYGPFWSVVGYVGAGIAAAGAIAFTALGPMSRVRSPDEDLPKAPQKGAIVIIFVAMVGVWLFATPANVWIVFGIAAACVLLWIFTFTRYSGLLGAHAYKVVRAKNGSTKEYKVIGGDELLPAARTQHDAGTPVQVLLEGAGYEPDYLWGRESRMRVKSRLLTLFLLMVAGGSLAAASAAFAIQVKLTNKPAATFLHPGEAPGLNDTPPPAPAPSGAKPDQP